MSARSYSFTSESVTEGHPDKVADQLSDTVLDAVLAADAGGRVACEVLITTGLVVVAGEITTETYVDIPRVVRAKIKDIGYTRAKYGFDADTCGVIVAIDEQSPDIAQGVDTSYELQHDPGDDDPLDQIGAGDQGMMFGYACTESEELMPVPIMLAHKICKRLAEVRKADVLPYLRPDGKAQVTVRYELDEHGRQQPVEIERVLISTQHREGLDVDALIKPDLVEHVLHPILPRHLYDSSRLEDRDFVYVNPTGKFVVGGPMGDTGVTGRKIIVDTYGGAPRPGRGEDVRDGARAREPHRGPRARPLRSQARRDPPGPRPTTSDLRQDGRVRPLRTRRPRLHLGAHRQGRRAARSGSGAEQLRDRHQLVALLDQPRDDCSHGVDGRLPRGSRRRIARPAVVQANDCPVVNLRPRHDLVCGERIPVSRSAGGQDR